MKKYFALIITFILILTCFTACKPKLKGGMVISNGSGDEYAAVTKTDGSIIRDEAGNLVVLVTDSNGKNVKTDSGEYQTNVIALERPIVIGRRIECPNYAINIPDGWSDNYTSSDLIITKDGTNDQIKIITAGDISLTTAIQGSQEIIDSASSKFSDSVISKQGVKIGDIEGDYVSVFIPDTGSGTATFLGYIFFKQNNDVYSVMLTSDRNIGENLDEFIDILETIEFIYQ